MINYTATDEKILTQKNFDKRIVWLDVVRLVAMFTVVCCHCTDPFNFYPGTSPDIGEIKFWGAAYGALLRPCVPLFVMITGALLLPVRGDISAFYRKRILRVFVPFLIWGVLYALFPWITGVLGLDSKVILDFFPYSGEEVMQQSLGVSLGYIAQIPVNFSALAVHLWYIYLLIGLYLYLPIFSAWVAQASDRGKRNFLLAWGVTTLLPYVHEFVAPYLWGECSWNAFGMLYYFAGFNGYLLLGHYLRHHDWSRTQLWGWGVPMFLAGYAVTFFGFRYMTSNPEATPEEYELFFTYCSLNVVLMTLPVFMWCKQVSCPFPPVATHVGQPDSLRLWCVYGALFLGGSQCGVDACLACSHLPPDSVGGSGSLRLVVDPCVVGLSLGRAKWVFG